jgi:excisionase family DNA binding protein
MSPKCNRELKNSNLDKRLYSVKEAAKYLGHTVWGIRSLIWSGTFPIIQYGRKQYIDITDLDDFIGKNKKLCR